MPGDKKDDDAPDLKKVGMLITIPFMLAVPPVIGLLIGHFLDRYFGTDPYLMYFLLILGLIAGIREFYRLVKKVGNAD